MVKCTVLLSLHSLLPQRTDRLQRLINLLDPVYMASSGLSGDDLSDSRGAAAGAAEPHTADVDIVTPETA